MGFFCRHDPSAKRKKYIMYPKWLVPWTDVARFLTISLILLACWGIAYSWLGEDAIPPKGQFFCLAILSLSSYVAGSLLERFTPVPPLLGMLLIGLLYRNVGIVQILGQYTHISTALRYNFIIKNKLNKLKEREGARLIKK